MIKSNVGDAICVPKMSLLALLILAVLTVGMITGCSSGKKSKDKDTTKYLRVYFNNTWDANSLQSHYADYDINTYNWSDSPFSQHIFFSSAGVSLAWLRGERPLVPENFWNTVDLMLVKGKYFSFYVKTYDSKTEEYSDNILSGFSIAVDPPTLATVDNSTGSITAGGTADTGTITITYEGLSHTFNFAVVNDASAFPPKTHYPVPM